MVLIVSADLGHNVTGFVHGLFGVSAFDRYRVGERRGAGEPGREISDFYFYHKSLSPSSRFGLSLIGHTVGEKRGECVQNQLSEVCAKPPNGGQETLPNSCQLILNTPK